MNHPGYGYVALDSQGVRIKGVLASDSREAAAAALRSRGLAPVRLFPTSSAKRRGVIKPRRLAEFLQELSLLTGAGASLTAGLSIMSQQAGNKELSRFIDDLEQSVARGDPVADALSVVLGDQAPFVPGLVAAGEASGDLSGAFRRAAAQIQRDDKIAQDFWAALSYPLFILIASVGAILILLLFVVPAIGPLLAESTSDTPVVLGLLLGASHVLVSHGWMIAAMLAVGVAAVACAARLGLLSGPLDWLFLDGPLREIGRSLIFGRFVGILGRLLASGVPTPEAARLAAAGVSNGRARQRIETASRKVLEGTRLSEALAFCIGIPGTVVRMASVGEEAGVLGDMLERAGDIEQDAALRKLQAIAQWLGPTTIVVLGAMIGLIMAGLLTGIASLGDSALG